jgi:hypothetical protein
MVKKIGVFLSIALCFIAFLNGLAQDNQSIELKKIDILLNKLWSLRYGDWGSLSDDLRKIGNPIIEPLIEMLRNEDTNGWSQYKLEWHQRRIAWALGQLSTERAIESLI